MYILNLSGFSVDSYFFVEALTFDESLMGSLNFSCLFQFFFIFECILINIFAKKYQLSRIYSLSWRNCANTTLRNSEEGRKRVMSVCDVIVLHEHTMISFYRNSSNPFHIFSIIPKCCSCIISHLPFPILVEFE